MMRTYARPFDQIHAWSAAGSPLLLRLRDDGGGWLRVHENGDLEVASGDARVDGSRSALSALRRQDPLWSDVLALHREIRTNLQPGDLTKPPRWNSSYPAQAFAGADAPVVEGYVGVEIEMGCRTDVLGFRDAAHAYKSADTLDALLRRVVRAERRDRFGALRRWWRAW